MAIDAGAVVTAGVAALGFVVWLVRLEGKVYTQGELHKKLVEDVTYIRGRIDAALNGKR
jgi:hypothetical protein